MGCSPGSTPTGGAAFVLLSLGLSYAETAEGVACHRHHPVRGGAGPRLPDRQLGAEPTGQAARSNRSQLSAPATVGGTDCTEHPAAASTRSRTRIRRQPRRLSGTGRGLRAPVRHFGGNFIGTGADTLIGTGGMIISHRAR